MNVTHLGVYGVLTKKGQVLLIKKTRGPYRGRLDLPGGKLEHGEQVMDGLKREVLEETGIVVNDAKQLMNTTTTVVFEDDRGSVSMYHVGLLYTVTDFDDSGLVTEMIEEDSAGGDWYAIDALTPEMLSPFARRTVDALKGNF